MNTNKIDLIKAEVQRLQNELIQEKEKGYGSDVDDACILELQNVLTYIDSLQEEPVSNPIDFEKELYKAFGQVKDFTLGMRIAKRFYDMGKNSQEPVSEELEEVASLYAADDALKPWQTMVKEAFKGGARWKSSNLWKDAQGDDLPEIDREVIVLTQHYPLENSEYAVYFAHRPNPDGWDGKSVTTGEIEHYVPKTYGKGGWSVSDVKYWLDIKFPNEQRGYERIRRIER